MGLGRVSIACLLSAACLLAHPPREARAFDGNRQGFILGFGAGAGNLTSGTKYDLRLPVVGVETELIVGYGINDRFAFLYRGMEFWYNSDRLFLTDLFPTVGLTYRLQPSERSFLVSAGGGGSIFAEGSYGEGAIGAGPAAYVGVGYEVARHWQVELTGVATGVLGTRAKLFNIALTLNLLGY